MHKFLSSHTLSSVSQGYKSSHCINHHSAFSSSTTMNASTNAKSLRKEQLMALPSVSCSLSSLPQARCMDHVSLHPSSMSAQHAAASEAKVRTPCFKLDSFIYEWRFTAEKSSLKLIAGSFPCRNPTASRLRVAVTTAHNEGPFANDPFCESVKLTCTFFSSNQNKRACTLSFCCSYRSLFAYPGLCRPVLVPHFTRTLIEI